MSDFITRHKREWDELEALVKRARRSMRRMTAEELSRLDVLYRRTTVHLSQAATRTSDEKLIWYLNGLTAAAHALIYLPPRRSAWAGAGRFVVEGFPRLVARCWRFHAISAVLLLGGGLLGYLVSAQDVSAAYALLPPGDVRLPGSTREQLLDVLRSGRETQGGEKFLFASFLLSHNMKVGLLAMTTGVLAAVPTTLLMVYNGMMLGAFAAVHHQAGIYAEFWAWILPHGVTELTAVVLCGGMGLRLGLAVIAPGLQTRVESLKQAGIETAQTCLGVAVMLVLAAALESYLRQSHLGTGPRLAVAAATAVFWALVFIYGMVRERGDRADAGPPLTDAAAAAR